jgi:hypothetical protein
MADDQPGGPLDWREQKGNTVAGQAQNPMGRGQWTRWGRGMCEGWSLEIGMAFRGSVVRRDIGRERTTWIASINSTGLGEFLEREIAMRRVEELVESSIELVLHDWKLYQAAKGKRQCAVECGYPPTTRKSKFD